MSVMKKDCENAIEELANSKQRAEEYKNEASMLKLSVVNLEAAKSGLEKSAQEFKNLYNETLKENETDKILRLELSKECDRLKNEVRQLNGTIEELNRNIQATKQESKKHDLLQLEITDYEKSLSELHSQLDAIRTELKEKETLAKQSEDEKAGLQVQLHLLDQQASAEQQRATESKVLSYLLCLLLD